MQKWIGILLFCAGFISIIYAQESDESNAVFSNPNYLNHLPTRDLNPWLYAYFPGTVVQSYRGVPYLHVHGSRAEEVDYQFENVNIRSDYTGLSAVRFIPEVLDKVELDKAPGVSQSSASAQVNHFFREPVKKLRLTMRETSDAFTHLYEKRIDTYSYGYNNLLFTAEGHALMDKLQFIAGFEWEHFDDHFRKYWEGFVIRENDDEPFYNQWGTNEPSFYQVFGTHEINVLPGNIPAANSNQFLFNGMLRYKIPFGNAKLIYLHDHHKYQDNTQPIRWLFNQSHIPEVIDHAHIFSAQFESQLPARIKSKLQFEMSSMRSKTMDPVQKDDFLNYSDLRTAFENTGTPSESYYWMLPYTNVHGFYFDWEDAILADYTKRTEDALTFSTHFEKTIRSNQLRTGVSYKSSQHRYYHMNHGVQTELGRYGTAVFADTLQLISYFNKSYGYDMFGNSINGDEHWFDGPRKPVIYSLYLEDEINADESTFTIGLSYKKINTGAYRDRSLTNPFYYRTSSQFALINSRYDKDKYFSYFLPYAAWTLHQNNRLRHKLVYKKSVSLPKLEDVYMSRGEKILTYSGGIFNAFPKGPNADPVVSKDIYLQTDFLPSEFLRMHLSIFYHTSDTWLQSKYVHVDLFSTAANYATLLNSGKNRTSGFEFSLHTEKSSFLFDANYTYANCKGTASYPNSNIRDAYYDSESALFSSGELYDLEFNQYHRFNTWLTLISKKDAFSPIRSSSLTILYHFNSGHSFWTYDGPIGSISPSGGSLLSDIDPRPRQNPIEITTPWIVNLDFKLEKKICLGSLNSHWFILVQNLLNRKNEQHVYWRTGQTKIDGTFDAWDGLESAWTDAYGARVMDFYQKINLDHRQHYARQQGGDLYGHPREIRFGVAVDFSR